MSRPFAPTEPLPTSPLPCLSSEAMDGNLFVSAYPPFACWNHECLPDIHAILETGPSDEASVPFGLYIHIPFCLERCHYCYYRSISDPNPSVVDSYLDGLIREAKRVGELPRFAGRPVTFAYVGGGTPSFLSATQLERLLNVMQSSFPWTGIQEVTVECSPRTVTPDRMRALRRAGVTRLSLGVQQLNDGVLFQNGRIHLEDDVRRAYAEIRRWDFDIVNIDLMVGLVGETDATFVNSLADVIAMAPESITLYQLEILPNTKLSRDWKEGRFQELADWETKRRRVARAYDMLCGAGLTLRSAYAAVRDPQRHRFLYQDLQYHGADVAGLGVASFSYAAGAHYQNANALAEYQQRLAANRLPVQRGFVLNTELQAVREFVLQLKLGHVSARYFRRKYHFRIFNRYRLPLRNFADAGWLTWDRQGIHVTRQGLLHVDRMLPSFYAAEHQSSSYW